MKIDRELQYKWNKVLRDTGLGVVQAGKPSDKERADQNRSKKKGLPEWAHWGEKGKRGRPKTYLKGSRK